MTSELVHKGVGRIDRWRSRKKEVLGARNGKQKKKKIWEEGSLKSV